MNIAPAPLADSNEASDAAFSMRLRECFEQAAERRSVQVRSVSLAGRSLALEFAGPALVPSLTEYLAGEDTRQSSPALTIKIWDSESTAIEPPRPPSRALLARGFSAALEGRLKLAYSAAASTLQAHGPECGSAHYWVRRSGAVPVWEAAQPFRTLLGWWAESMGGVLAHAAVVGRAERAVLLVGASGAGKSTSALACVAAGMAFLSDDSVLIELEGDGVVAHGLYRTAKVGRPLLKAQLSGLHHFDTQLAHDGGKAVLAFPQLHEQLLPKAKIAGIVRQTIAPRRESTLVRESKAGVLRALAPSTLLQSAGNGRPAFAVLAEIVHRVPCYRLEAGYELTALASRLAELVA